MVIIINKLWIIINELRKIFRKKYERIIWKKNIMRKKFRRLRIIYKNNKKIIIRKRKNIIIISNCIIIKRRSGEIILFGYRKKRKNINIKNK